VLAARRQQKKRYHVHFRARQVDLGEMKKKIKIHNSYNID
jgi:hypothetical protein